ncbi:hypothetical protein B0H11DRAFT_1915810 [Mycena galericulata]|nr:hypothetical protein B0H11DRAFT_1915810 [Mycena galericulata]
MGVQEAEKRGAHTINEDQGRSSGARASKRKSNETRRGAHDDERYEWGIRKQRWIATEKIRDLQMVRAHQKIWGSLPVSLPAVPVHELAPAVLAMPCRRQARHTPFSCGSPVLSSPQALATCLKGEPGSKDGLDCGYSPTKMALAGSAWVSGAGGGMQTRNQARILGLPKVI